MRKPPAGSPDVGPWHQRRRARRAQLDRERASLLGDYLRFTRTEPWLLVPIAGLALATSGAWRTAFWIVGVVAVVSLGALYIARAPEAPRK